MLRLRRQCVARGGGWRWLLPALLCCAGCQSPETTGNANPAPLPPFLLRMQSFYPDLASGRFLCLAHFEAPEQAELFRVMDRDTGRLADTQPTLSVIRSRDETGSGGLYAPLANETAELRLDGVRSRELALIRNWEPYTLLLFSLYGPQDGGSVEFTICSGTDVPLTWSRTLNLGAGWNLIRLDLAEIGEAVDLTDVRRLSWRALTPAAPLDLFLDDVILADNTRYLLDSVAAQTEDTADAPTTALYAFEQGRRVHVGCPGRFEVAFADGLVVAWYAQPPPTTATPPQQPSSIELAPRSVDDESLSTPRENLALRSGLGPHPIPLPDRWQAAGGSPVAYDDPEHFANWGRIVATRQWLREATPHRVVLQGQWVFLRTPAETPPVDGATPDRPAHTWQYVIYPSGEIFVALASAPADREWAAPLLGYAVGVPGRRGFAAATLESAPGEQPLGVLWSRPGDAADLLWAPHAADLTTHALLLGSTDGRRQSAILGERAADGLVESAHLLRVWPPDLNTSVEAESIAADYRQPATLALYVGRLLTSRPGDLDGDGYNEAEGLYELAPADALMRVAVDPGQRLRHRVRLRLHDSEDRDCWLYLDGRRVTATGRDRAGRLIFTLPTPVSQPVTLEAHLRPRGNAPTPRP